MYMMMMMLRAGIKSCFFRVAQIITMKVSDVVRISLENRNTHVNSARVLTIRICRTSLV